MSITPVSDTDIGALSAIPFALGGIGHPVESFALATRSVVTATEDTPVTVADANVTATSVIFFTLKTAHSPGALPTVKTITAGTGFTFAADSGDTSVYNYLRFG